MILVSAEQVFKSKPVLDRDQYDASRCQVGKGVGQNTRRRFLITVGCRMEFPCVLYNADKQHHIVAALLGS